MDEIDGSKVLDGLKRRFGHDQKSFRAHFNTLRGVEQLPQSERNSHYRAFIRSRSLGALDKFLKDVVHEHGVTGPAQMLPSACLPRGIRIGEFDIERNRSEHALQAWGGFAFEPPSPAERRHIPSRRP